MVAIDWLTQRARKLRGERPILTQNRRQRPYQQPNPKIQQSTTMMKLAMLQRFAARGILRSATSTPTPLMTARPFSSLTDRAAAIEQELRQKHHKAAHASDGSRGDWDKPKSKEEMEQLHNLYHKIDDLESELAALKAEVAEQRRIFAVEAPDGTSDARLQEELEEVKHIIEDAAVLEDKEAVAKMHKKEQEVKKFHARDPEHDW